MKEQVRVAGSPTRCPYCHDEIVDRVRLVACADCGARHHSECHEEHGVCAACGSREALFSPRALEGDVRSALPPVGSRVQVTREEGATRYTWHADRMPFFGWLSWILCFPLWPVALYLLWDRKRRARYDARGRELHSLTLSPDRICFPTKFLFGQVPKRVEAPRGEVGLVSVHRAGAYTLSVEVGGTKHSYYPSGLKEVELEWLAEEVRAWQREPSRLKREGSRCDKPELESS